MAIKKEAPPIIEKRLKKLRSEINEQDRLLLLILKKRFAIVKKIAALKEKHSLPVLQKSRWKAVMNDRIKWGEKFKLNSHFTSALMTVIHKESIRFQNSLNNKKGKKNE